MTTTQTIGLSLASALLALVIAWTVLLLRALRSAASLRRAREKEMTEP